MATHDTLNGSPVAARSQYSEATSKIFENERDSSHGSVGSNSDASPTAIMVRIVPESAYVAKDYNEDILEKQAVTTDGCTQIMMLVIRVFFCFLSGTIFGIALEKGRVFEPKNIRKQMVFESFIMLKMFLAAAAAGQICFAAMSIIPPTKTKFEKLFDNYMSSIHQKDIIQGSLGGFILGCGMTLSGACPGMVLAQVGAWVPNSGFTLLGALIASLIYGMVALHLSKLSVSRLVLSSKTPHHKFKVRFATLAIPMSVCLMVGVILLEHFVPWNLETEVRNADDGNFLTVRAWPPSVAGVVIGILQVIISLAVEDSLGGSSAYVTIVSQWVVTKKLKQWFPYLENSRWGLRNWWQVIYVIGAIVGGAISSLSSNSWASVDGVNVPSALGGGFLMLCGARLASGCTSGHGISGLSLLVWLSFLVVPAMFAGAIGTAYSMQATGDLTMYVS